MRRISVLSALLIAVLCLLFVGCGTNSTATSGKTGGAVWSRVEQNKVIKVAFEGTYPPFNYQNEQKQFAGFDVDISNEIAKRLGVKAEFIATPWEGLIGGLQSDKFDIVIAQMGINEERKKSVDFTDPYVITGAVLVTRQDTNDIVKLEDIKNKKVGVGAGTTFEKVARSVQGADVRNYKSAGEYFTDLQNKRLDAIINDNLVATYRIKQNNLSLKVSPSLVSKDLIGMAIKQGNTDFVEKVNKALADIKEDGTYEQLFVKWFGIKPINE